MWTGKTVAHTFLSLAVRDMSEIIHSSWTRCKSYVLARVRPPGGAALLASAPFQALLFSLRLRLCKCWLTPRMDGM